MENTTTPTAQSTDPPDDHTPWTVEQMTHGKDAGLHQVVNSQGWVIASCLVYEDACLLAAAPDLLTAGEAMLAHTRTTDAVPADLDRGLERAAARARGRSWHDPDCPAIRGRPCRCDEFVFCAACGEKFLPGEEREGFYVGDLCRGCEVEAVNTYRDAHGTT